MGKLLWPLLLPPPLKPFAALGTPPPATPLLPVCPALTHCSQWHTWPAVPPPSPRCTSTEAGSRLRASFAVWGEDPGCLLAPQLPFNNIAFKEAFLSGGFPRSSVGKESVFQCRRPQFSPWVRKIPYRTEWQPTPVVFPGKFHGQGNLAGYSPWGRKESDTTERRTCSLLLDFCLLEVDSQLFIHLLCFLALAWMLLFTTCAEIFHLCPCL